VMIKFRWHGLAGLTLGGAIWKRRGSQFTSSTSYNSQQTTDYFCSLPVQDLVVRCVRGDLSATDCKRDESSTYIGHALIIAGA
jgi:hypothetical protein